MFHFKIISSINPIASKYEILNLKFRLYSGALHSFIFNSASAELKKGFNKKQAVRSKFW